MVTTKKITFGGTRTLSYTVLKCSKSTAARALKRITRIRSKQTPAIIARAAALAASAAAQAELTQNKSFSGSRPDHKTRGALRNKRGSWDHIWKKQEITDLETALQGQFTSSGNAIDGNIGDWENVAEAVWGRTVEECGEKFEVLRKYYKEKKEKRSSEFVDS
jgi:NTP pyrophosphatase (non-canonical NTP hydrolase)